MHSAGRVGGSKKSGTWHTVDSFQLLRFIGNDFWIQSLAYKVIDRALIRYTDR